MSKEPNIGHLRTAAIAVTVALVLALGAAGCVSQQSWEATRLLQDIDAGAGPSALKDRTPLPERTTVAFDIDGRRTLADLYEPMQPIGAGLVLVPGFTPDGKDDTRVVDLAMSLARAKFLVLVPDLAGSRTIAVRPEDARTIADAAIYLSGQDLLGEGQETGVAAISYAVGLAIVASGEPDAQDAIDFVVGLGGYHNTRAVVAFATTGHFREAPGRPWQAAATREEAKWVLLASNADLLSEGDDRVLIEAIAERRRAATLAPIDDLVAGLGPEGLALLELMTNEDPDAVTGLLRRLPPAIRERLHALSPANHDLDHLAGRLILIHGRADTLIPYSESLALARAVPGTRVFVIDGFSHIDPSSVGTTGKLQLISAIQAVLDRRQEVTTAP